MSDWNETHRETLKRRADVATATALGVAIDAALKEVDRLTKERDAVCDWTRDESFLDERDKWDTACARAFTFIDGGPRENNYTFYPGCGRKVRAR